MTTTTSEISEIAVYAPHIRFRYPSALPRSLDLWDPNKTTGLILLDGEAELSFLTNTVNVKPVTKVMIRKGLFHSTKAISENGACVFEIETPVDKHDLVRLDDKYGREGTPYEDSTFETPKAEDCLWINDSDSDYNFSGCNLKVEVIDSVNKFNKKDDEENIIFLRGGIKTDNGNFVAQAGDVVSSIIIKKLIKLFTIVSDNTIIMTIKKNINEWF